MRSEKPLKFSSLLVASLGLLIAVKILLYIHYVPSSPRLLLSRHNLLFAFHRVRTAPQLAMRFFFHNRIEPGDVGVGVCVCVCAATEFEGLRKRRLRPRRRDDITSKSRRRPPTGCKVTVAMRRLRISTLNIIRFFAARLDVVQGW